MEEREDLTFDSIKDGGLLLFNYERGSCVYGLQREDGMSDIDTGGIFAYPKESVCDMCFGEAVPAQINSEKYDDTWYSFGKFISLLKAGNPSMLEAIFVPEKNILFCNDFFKNTVLKNREAFITENVFDTFIGYALNQVKKARGLKKKIVNPVTERKDPLDFTFTYDKEGNGSIPFREFLGQRSLLQEYCGISVIPNMYGMYAVFYDYVGHALDCEGGVIPGEIPDSVLYNLQDVDITKENRRNYRGIISEDSDALRLSSIPKGEKVLAYVSYNKNGYSCHCSAYKEYQEWLRERNPVRFADNLDGQYDRKNMMHCIRLMHMAGEALEGKGIELYRTWDHDFLMDIRNGKFNYEYIYDYAEKYMEKLRSLREHAKLPLEVDERVIKEIKEAYMEGYL